MWVNRGLGRCGMTVAALLSLAMTAPAIPSVAQENAAQPGRFIKKVVAVLLTLISILVAQQQCLAQYVGVTLGWKYSDELDGPSASKPNTPLFNAIPGTPYRTWDSWAEELGAAGVDFVCPNLRGSFPHTEQSPVNIAPLLTALRNRGQDNKVKLAAFDDNYASWYWQWNGAHGRTEDTAIPFDIRDKANWVYIWDKNIKIFFQTVPDANRFKLNGRPVIIFWSGNPQFISNMNGNASRALTYVRQKCRSTFGFDPYIIVNSDFLANDPTCNNPAIVDAVHSWFKPSRAGNPNGAYSLATFNGTKIGVSCPGFQTPQAEDGRWIDPNHGVTLDSALQNTRGAGALLTLVEGFTDWIENASLSRVRNVDPSWNPLRYEDTYYDYPNQRINILRKHSNYPFPANLKEEAESCDYFGGGRANPGNPNYYRNGNIWIEECGDTGGGYNVSGTGVNQWLEWKQVPIQGTSQHLQVRVASPFNGTRLHFVIDGVTYPSITVPNTGGFQSYVTVDDGRTYAFAKGSRHTVQIVFETGGFNLNYWQAHNDIPLNKQISLKSNANNRWVSADNAGASPLIANRSAAGLWETFTVVDASESYGYGAVALRASANNRYVTADPAGKKPLIASRTIVGPWEAFLWTDQGDGTISLRSLANSQVVCADKNGVNPLINNCITPGPWESFTLSVH